MPDNSSHNRIKKLSPLLINQLAAGEVVTRPAAVVKELLENAIDANATHIEINITQGGMGMIEVVDNGKGIHPDDMIMAITRHATSKVADIANLHGITTLGFRGEALAATAAVSRLTLSSSDNNTGIGRQLQVAGVLSDQPKLLPVVHNRGTTVTVKDLYFNVPARRGNLKSIATEFGHIETIVREVALAHADVTLNLFHDYKSRLSLSSSADSGSGGHLPLERLEQALGRSLREEALELLVDLSSLLKSSFDDIKDNSHDNDQLYNISGWLWTSNDKHSTLPKLLYINGRLVKEILISNQLRQLAYSANLDNVGYALYFELPNRWLNINVHPAKQRIKISPLNNIMAHLNHSVGLLLKQSPHSKPADSILYSKQSLKGSSNRHISADGQFWDLVLDQQVQVTTNPYQLSNSTPKSKKLADYKKGNEPAIPYLQQANSADILINSSDLNNHSESANVDSEITHRIKSKILLLPQCLEMINGFSEGSDNKSVTTKVMVELSSSVLLFYSQQRFLLIKKDDWQQSLESLFANYSVDDDVVTSSPMLINKQLTNITSKLSLPQALSFVVQLEEVLNTNAFKSLDSSELVTSML